jgi:acetoin utilization protein AcuB
MDLHVRRYMTTSPTTVTPETTIVEAHRIMRREAIRHLPVVDATHELVGLVSIRDLDFAETFRSFDGEIVKVGDAMFAKELYTVEPDTDLLLVARHLLETKYGCAIVTDGGRIVGIFTVIDALRALIDTVAETRRVRPV